MSFTEFSLYISNFSLYILIAGTVCGLLFYKRLDPVCNGLFYYVALMLAVDRSFYLLGAYTGNNHAMVPIYALLELGFFTWFYNYCLLKKQSIPLVVLGLVGVVYICWEFIQDFVLTTQQVKQFQPYGKVVDNFAIIIFALSYLYIKISSFEETHRGHFWLNIIILVFFTFNTIIFLPFNFLVNEETGLKFYFWTINRITLLLFYIYLAVTILKHSLRNSRK